MDGARRKSVQKELAQPPEVRQEKCGRRGRLGEVGEEVGAGAGVGSEGEDSGCLIRLGSQRREGRHGDQQRRIQRHWSGKKQAKQSGLSRALTPGGIPEAG